MFKIFSNNTRPKKVKADFISIGDMAVDVFIRLKEAREGCNPQTKKCELCLNFGDKIPYDFSEELLSVGNSANAAVSVARLGISSAFISNVGCDKDGTECIENLRKEGVIADHVTIQDGKNTNKHYVLWYDRDRTILIKHERFEYSLLPEFEKPKWIYLSSMGENSLEFHDEIMKYLEKNPDVKLLFQPGTFQIKFGVEKMAKFYARSEIFACNAQEAQKILQVESLDFKLLLSGIAALGPKVVLITDGPDGAYILDNRDNANAEIKGRSYFFEAYPNQAPAYERTGAGDSFTSTFVVATLLGKDFLTSLKWAGSNAVNVCKYVGAQKGLLNQEGLLKVVNEADPNWNVVELK